MQNLNCIMIDSPVSALEVLEDFLHQSHAVSLNKKFCAIQEAEDYCKKNHADIVLCNIDMLEKEDIDSLKDLQPSSMIVCAGPRSEIERKGFEKNIFAYLYKPFSYDRILSLISKANIYMGFSNVSSASSKNFVFIKSEYKTIRVDLDDVLYCESLKDYTQIFLKGKQKPLITLQNLKSIAAKLPLHDYVRVHRSYIVSVNKIDAISKNEIVIGQSEIPIGDAYREGLYELIEYHS